MSSASGFKVYLGNGDGTFQGGGITSGQIVSIADINGDGVLDLISGAEGRNPVVVVWFGAGNGAFNGPVTLAVRPAAPEFAAVGDFNVEMGPRTWLFRSTAVAPTRPAKISFF